MARNRRPASKERRLHRAFGAGAAIFIIFMVISGLIINHSNQLGLDQRHVSQPFLLSWYGLGKPENIDSFAVDNQWLSFAGSQLYLNENPVTNVSGGLGAVSSGDLLIAAGRDEILLMYDDGRLIERLPWEHPDNEPIEALGLTENGHVVVKSRDQVWLADSQLLGWKLADESGVNSQWSFSKPAPTALLEAINRNYRGDGPSLERLLLDIHSGRIFGTMGMIVYDLLALIFAFLAISGLVLWFRGRRNGKRSSSVTPSIKN
jgi:hypothetical protein